VKITCPSCGSKYAIADDKVRGRRVKVRCKSCSEPIIVDGSSGDQELEATRAEPVFGGQSSAPPAGDMWSVNLSDTDQRSMTTNEIVDAYNQGMLNDAFVWKEGMGDWVPLASAPDLAPYLSSPQHSAPAAAEPSGFSSPFHVPDRPAEPARVAGGRSRGRGDLFGGIASAGSEEEAVAAASVPPSSSESRMTGQRNENSVLFSLDALKAGVDAAPARPVPTRGGSSAPGPSEAKANLDDIMSLGGGSSNPLFSMHANQALLAAPPPPPEPPPRPATPVDAIISHSVAPAPQKGGGKAIIAISAAVGLLAILGIVAVLVLGKGKDDDKSAKTDSAEKSDGKKSEVGKGTTGSGDRPSGTESSNTGSSDPATPGNSADPKAPVTEEEKKRFAEAMKKKEEEDKKTGTDTKKEEEDTKKKENPSSGVGSFDKGAAIAALSGAAAQASGCKRPGGPTGAGKAIVTFAPSGRVTSANVSGGDFGGSPVGSCVASVFRRASVPAFNGDPVTVSKSFNIAP
jgi:predicted Zn finger-like uncharacterized protein